MVHLSADGRQALDAFIDGVEQDPSTPPFVFASTTADGEIYSRGTGYSRVGDPQSGAVDLDSVFWICSQSKLITHLAALQLIEAGKLSLEDPVSKYLPEFEKLIIIEESNPSNIATSARVPKSVNYRPAATVMTVEHLMTFTSGLYYPSGAAVDDWDKDIQNTYTAPHDETDPAGGFIKEIKKGLPGVPLKFEPGTDWAYGWSSDILGFVVEKATGQTLESYMKRNIFDPLGMTRTSFYLSPHIKEKKVGMSYRRPNDGIFQPWEHRFYEEDPDKLLALCGGAYLLSSARDYLTLLRHLLQIHSNTLPPHVKAVISRQTLIDKVFEPALAPNGQKSIETMLASVVTSADTGAIQWGYGGMALALNDWTAHSEGKKTKLRKAGSAFWFGFLNTLHFIDPATGVAAIFQVQTLPPLALDQSILRLESALEGLLYRGLVE